MVFIELYVFIIVVHFCLNIIAPLKPIGKQQVNQEAIERAKLHTYIAAGVKFTCHQSKYGSRKTTVRSSRLYPARNLTQSMDKQAFSQIQAQVKELEHEIISIDNQRKQKERSLSDLRERLDGLEEEKRELMKRKKDMMQLTNQRRAVLARRDTLLSKLAGYRESVDEGRQEQQLKLKLVAECEKRLTLIRQYKVCQL